MILINSIFRWLMLFMGGIMILMSIIAMIVSQQAKKSTPKWSFYLLIIGIIQISYVVIRMISNSYNTF